MRSANNCRAFLRNADLEAGVRRGERPTTVKGLYLHSLGFLFCCRSFRGKNSHPLAFSSFVLLFDFFL